MKKRIILISIILFCLILGGCSGKKNIISIGVDQRLADSGLVGALTEQFLAENAEAGYECEITTLDAEGIQAAMDSGADGQCLMITGDGQTAAFIAEQGLSGGEFCFDPLLLVGPVEDKAGLWQLKDVAGKDVLKHIALTKCSFVHAPADTALGMAEQRMWQAAELQPEGEWYIAASSEGLAVLDEAQANSAYALVDRQSMAMVSAEYESLKVIKISLDGMAISYYAMAPPTAEGKEDDASQAFARWLFGESAKAVVAEYNKVGEEAQFFPGNAESYRPEQPTPTPAPTPEPTPPPASEPPASESPEPPASEPPASPAA